MLHKCRREAFTFRMMFAVLDESRPRVATFRSMLATLNGRRRGFVAS
jgi:hypothetical protein